MQVYIHQRELQLELRNMLTGMTCRAHNLPAMVGNAIEQLAGPGIPINFSFSLPAAKIAIEDATPNVTEATLVLVTVAVAMLPEVLIANIETIYNPMTKEYNIVTVY